jgi:hypothetical protein
MPKWGQVGINRGVLPDEKDLALGDEEELLSYHLKDINSDGEHNFIIPATVGAGRSLRHVVDDR